MVGLFIGFPLFSPPGHPLSPRLLPPPGHSLKARPLPLSPVTPSVLVPFELLRNLSTQEGLDTYICLEHPGELP